jgi:hypothetical protein
MNDRRLNKLLGIELPSGERMEIRATWLERIEEHPSMGNPDKTYMVVIPLLIDIPSVTTFANEEMRADIRTAVRDEIQALCDETAELLNS